MKTIESEFTNEFLTVLAAEGRSPEIPESADVYGWLIGDWELEVCHYLDLDVKSRSIKGEVHAGWVLQGRAVQDVWFYPRASEPTGSKEKLITYGTTLRVWDPKIQGWHIMWSNPVRNHYEKQIGRRIGKDIVQVGARPDGTPTRWMFTEITNDSFHWLGEALKPDGKNWQLEAEFRGRRMG
jgi:hypothetical protein